MTHQNADLDEMRFCVERVQAMLDQRRLALEEIIRLCDREDTPALARIRSLAEVGLRQT